VASDPDTFIEVTEDEFLKAGLTKLKMLFVMPASMFAELEFSLYGPGAGSTAGRSHREEE